MVGEASRSNGAKGGRPRGSLRGTLPPEEYEARKKARKGLQELCQRREEEHVGVLEAIAGNSEEPANARVSAISLLFDRGRGKAVQSERQFPLFSFFLQPAGGQSMSRGVRAAVPVVRFGNLVGRPKRAITSLNRSSLVNRSSSAFIRSGGGRLATYPNSSKISAR